MTREEYAVAFDRGYSKTLGFVCSRGASRDVAEDLAQAAWAKGWQYRAQIRDSSKVDSWVNTIAFNLFRGSFRKASTVELLPEDHPASPRTSAEAIDCQRLLARCSQSERKLLEGHYMAGCTSAELGRRLGCSAVAVRVRLLRLRHRLRATDGPRAIATSQQVNKSAAGAEERARRCHWLLPKPLPALQEVDRQGSRDEDASSRTKLSRRAGETVDEVRLVARDAAGAAAAQEIIGKRTQQEPGVHSSAPTCRAGTEVEA
jgi:RNA polymerase sigma factor (sigma-70 family)